MGLPDGVPSRPDPTQHLQAGAKRVIDHFKGKPNKLVSMTPEARNILLGALAAVSSLAGGGT